MSTLQADPRGPQRTAARVPEGRPVRLTGWGGGPACAATSWRPASIGALGDGLARTRELTGSGAIARGLGRAYGDAARRTGGLVIDTSALAAIELDEAAGIVTAGGGVPLARLLAAVIDRGFILPVVPGTQHVTVGGAIAADIHGKNHLTDGTFCAHVTWIELLGSDGERHELTPGDPRFAATAGGMGLTGIVVRATLRLRRVHSGRLSVDTDRVDDLDAALAALRAPGGPHRVAWLDLLAGAEPRGVVTRARHVEEADATLVAGSVTRPARATVPARWPAGALRPATVRAFNALRFRTSPRRARDRLEPFAAHMFPLDGLEAWPRLYGPAGFLQYQVAVPSAAERTLRDVLAVLRDARVPSYLAVLKDFGPAGEGMLSFPIQGWTLAIDVPAAVPLLGQALARCDDLVAGAGGRVYLAKDARLRPETLRAMYPRLDEWRAVRRALDPSGVWRSDLAVRTGLLEDVSA